LPIGHAKRLAFTELCFGGAKGVAIWDPFKIDQIVRIPVSEMQDFITRIASDQDA